MSDAPDRVLSRRKPRESAKMFRDEMRPNIVSQQGEWLDWNGKCYVVIEDATIRAEVAEWADEAYEQFLQEPEEGETEGKIAFRKFEPKPADTTAIVTSLVQLVHRPAEQFLPPCWLNSETGLDPQDIIACENGLLDIQTRTLYAHTPNFFTRTAIPIIYDPNAPEPTRWLECLSEWFEGRQPLADLLQEAVGYSLSADTSQQTVIFLWGVPRGGKGTTLRILTDLIGRDNVHAPSIKEIAGRFGLMGCIGKTLITITDMNVDNHTEVGEAAVSINKISGEDRVSIERKGIEPWSGTLPGRIWIVGNSLPDFGSHSTAVVARLVILPFEVSFLGREDRQLTNRQGTGKLQQELPGILNWALEGLARLRERGRFPDCPESDSAKIRMLHMSQPIRGFVEEKCELGDVHVDKSMLYARYRAYCKTIGERPQPLHSFSEKLMELFPTIGASKRRSADGTRPPIFDGIRLNADEGMRLYQVAPGYDLGTIDDGLGVTFWDIIARDMDDEPVLKPHVESEFAE